jgi:hypothetical protein
MLFRNPFRFGKPMPWKPAGDTQPIWSIEKGVNVLSLSGFTVDIIEHAETYSQLFFADSTIDSEDGKRKLKGTWKQILHTFGACFENTLPLAKPFLAAAAVSISFGLNQMINPFEQQELLQSFVAYLAIVFCDEQATLTTYIPGELLEESRNANGRAFGKPVWDFQYPDSSIFVTKNKFVGCAISTTQQGDEVFVALGSTYPMILRPNGVDGLTRYLIRGFAYVDGVMYGECAESSCKTFQIQ